MQYLLVCTSDSICHQLFTFIQIGSGHTVPDQTSFVIKHLCALLKMKSYLAGRRGKLYVTDILPGGYKNESRICHLEVKLHCRLSN